MASTALRRPLAVRGGPPGVIAVVLIVLARGAWVMDGWPRRDPRLV
jgi:hypothetical protein